MRTSQEQDRSAGQVQARAPGSGRGGPDGGSLDRVWAALARIVVHEGMVASQLPDVSRSEEIGPAAVAIQHKEREAGRDIRCAIASVVPIP